MDEKTRQIVEDSEKIMDRNRELESELHSLKVENERLKEENETLFATQGGADPQNLRDALQWLHDQGGIGEVYSRYKDVVLGEAEEALEVAYSEDIEKRLMPEGMEWPRFEDGEPVRIGDEVPFGGDSAMTVTGVEMADEGHFILHGRDGGINRPCQTGYQYGQRVKRPAPKVLDADGAEIRVGDTVYLLPGDWCDKFPLLRCHEWDEMKVLGLRPNHDTGRIVCGTSPGSVVCYPYPPQLTHRAPVLAADGKPLREGETVWHVETGREYVVVEPSYGKTAVVRLAKYDDAEGEQYAPDQLTHERPETDSWERLEEDATLPYIEYCEANDLCAVYMGGDAQERAKAEDLVRRAKALAERGK